MLQVNTKFTETYKMRPKMPNFKTNNNAYHNLGCTKLGNEEETIKQYRGT